MPLPSKWSWIVRYLLAAAIGGLAFAVRYAMIPVVGMQTPYAVHLVAVLFVAARLGTGPALVTAVLGIFAFESLLYDPHGAWTLRVAALIRGALLLLITLYLGLTADGLRSARERAEASARALRESEEHLRATFQQAAMGIIEADRQGHILAVNDRACETLGYAREELLGTSIHDLTYPPDRAMSEEKNAAVNEGRVRQVVYEKRYSRRDGPPLWARVSVSAVRDAEGRFLSAVGTVEDITDRKKAEEAMQQTLEELERSNYDLEQFAYIASHDLQEPLRSIHGYLELLEMSQPDGVPPESRRYLDAAQDNVERMQHLILGILDYSRVGRQHRVLASVSLEALLDEVLQEHQKTLQDARAVVTHEPLPEVVGDPRQLRQLFSNLISNAVKFRRPEQVVRIHFTAAQLDGKWRLAVRDNGIGIDPRFRERVFKMFRRLHARDEYPGAGIGLAICKKIVERHGGRIWVDPQDGCGTTLCFTLSGPGHEG